MPLFVSAAVRDLWAPDEPRYAEVARELVAHGDILVMRLCGELYPDKPPLLFWCAALLGVLSGWSVFTMRLVSIAATLATAALLPGIIRGGRAESAVDETTRAASRLAPLLFLSFPLVVELGGRLQIDPLLMFATTAALRQLAHEDESPRRLLFAGALAGLGGLAKGPVAWLHVALPLLVWSLLGLRARLRFRNWGPGLALALFPVTAWAIAAALREPALFRDLFYGQHVERAMKGTHHAAPMWKHAATMPAWLLPWTPAIGFGLADAWRSRRACESAETRSLLRAATWLLVMFAFFSLIPPKRDLYLLPAYPAAAILGAHGLVASVGSKRRAWTTWVPTLLLVLVGAALAGFALVGAGKLGGEQRFLPAAFVAAVVAFVGAWTVRPPGERAPLERAALTAALLGATYACAFAVVYPLVDAEKSPRAVAAVLAARPEKPAAIPCLGVKPEGYRFYGARLGGVPTVAVDDVDAFLARESTLGLVRADFFARFPAEARERHAVVHEERVGSRRVLVVVREVQSAAR